MGSLPVRRCSVEGCGRKHHSHGMCRKHVRAAATKGLVTIAKRPIRLTIDSFKEKIAVASEPHPVLGAPCHNWTGNKDRAGYGRIKVKSRQTLAHRYIYEHVHGPIPEHLEPHHMCENTSCVNVLHLQLLTPLENNLKSNNPTARNARKTHCLRGHPLPPYKLGGRRVCKQCQRKKPKEQRRQDGNSYSFSSGCPV